MRKKLFKREVAEVLEILDGMFPNPKPALNYTTPFELLIATILSAQCTDVRVNKTTEVLFKSHNTAESFADLDPKDLEPMIKECGLFRSKANNIVQTAKIVRDKYAGEVPQGMEELTDLPGVGRKTANVVRSNAFGIPGIAVDTHVFRVTNRIGIVDETDVYNTEMALQKALPKEKWTDAHHQFIYLGRSLCSARKTLCEECPLNHLCRFVKISQAKVKK